MHAVSEEQRRAGGPAFHAVTHSVGLVVTDSDPGDHGFSFGIRASEIVELGGWSWAGPVDVEAFDNPPPSPLAVLTAHLDNAGPEALESLRELIDQHAERFGECRVWVARDASDALRRWVAVGCVGDEAPTAEYLAEVNTVAPRPPDKPTVERSGMGWETSEPVTDEREAV